jgi:hypothetical protein
MTTIEIDLNVRCGPNLTYAGFEDISDFDVLHTGEEVALMVEAFGIVGTGIVERISLEQELVYLRVDFSSLDFSCGEG